MSTYNAFVRDYAPPTDEQLEAGATPLPPCTLIQTQWAGVQLYAGGAPWSFGGTVIANWKAEDGDPTTIDLAAYLEIRPLGNAEDGSATDGLAAHSIVGHAPRNLEPGKRYPDALAPFDLEIRHKEVIGTFSGWGWRAEMHGSAGNRDPSVRAIGVYSDAAASQYLFTTGAFVQGVSEWQVDDEGHALTVWYTECPAGQLQQAKTDWHFAVLWASVQEGIATLGAGVDAIRYLFWDRIQGQEPQVGQTWVDTGATVAQLVAAGIYRLDSIVELVPGQVIRIGDAETVFTGYWPTAGSPNTYIAIAPHVAAVAGGRVWKSV